MSEAISIIEQYLREERRQGNPVTLRIKAVVEEDERIRFRLSLLVGPDIINITQSYNSLEEAFNDLGGQDGN